MTKKRRGKQRKRTQRVTKLLDQSPAQAPTAASEALKPTRTSEPPKPTKTAEPRQDSEPAAPGPRPPRIIPTPAPAPAPPERAAATQTLHTSAWQRHDLLVIVGALVLLAGGGLGYRASTAPRLTEFSHLGLKLRRPSVWLPPTPVVSAPSALAMSAGVPAPAPAPAADGLPYHVIYQSPAPSLTRLEIHIDERPTFNNLRAALALSRVNRYGEVYWVAHSDEETIEGRDWLRTRFRYAYKASESDSPKVATGIEYATLNGGLVYIVTVHGAEETVDALRALVVPSLGIDADHPAANRKR